MQAPVFDTNVRPDGVGLATLTEAASEAPLLVIATVRISWVPGVTPPGTDWWTDRSALTATLVETPAELLALDGSPVGEEAVAANVYEDGDVCDDGTVNVVWMVLVVPADRVPSAQGKAAAQSPEFDTKARPAGVGAATWTEDASDGPVFDTVVV